MPSKKPPPLSFEDKLAAATTSEARVTICLNGSLAAEVERLDRELTEARVGAETMSQRGDLRKLAEQIEALRAEMQRHSQEFVVRGLSRPKNLALKAEHPPRKDNKDDLLLGFNQDTYYVPLVRECIVEPALAPSQFDRLVEVISDGEFSKLALACYSVTSAGVTIPFSVAASSVLRSSGETSKPQSA